MMTHKNLNNNLKNYYKQQPNC